MAKVKYSAAALRDMEQIGDYIAGALKNPKAALNTVSRIQDAAGRLAGFPLIGSPLSVAVKIETDYRFLVCGNYHIFYRAQADIVYIDRVLYGRRDYMAILFGDASTDNGEQTE